MNKIYDVVIIGGGPGGYTAALYAARAGLSTLVVEKLSPGGQMALTHMIENYPGFPDGVDGFTLGESMQQGAERFGAETLLAEVTAVGLKGNPKILHTSEGDVFARTVIIATGADPRRLGVPMEWELTGRGVSYCAACDGMFFRNKTVVVVGGGNSAVADALILSRLAKKVILVHRRDTLRATKVYHDQLKKAENVEFRWNTQLVNLRYDDSVNGAVLRDVLSGEETVIDCEGVLISVGRQPNTSLFRGQLELDEGGYIVAGENTRTSIPGVFAVGDVRTKAVRQIVTAVADGAVAAHHAEEFLVQ